MLAACFALQCTVPEADSLTASTAALLRLPAVILCSACTISSRLAIAPARSTQELAVSCHTSSKASLHALKPPPLLQMGVFAVILQQLNCSLGYVYVSHAHCSTWTLLPLEEVSHAEALSAGACTALLWASAVLYPGGCACCALLVTVAPHFLLLGSGSWLHS